MEYKLIPMTEFVLNEQFGLGNEFIQESEFVVKVCKYAKFLNQKLSERYEINGVMAHPLNRFVPCDLDGKVYEKPDRYEDYLAAPESFDGNKESDVIYDYEESKERVLFEGFKIGFNNGVFYPLLDQYPVAFFNECNKWVISDYFSTIEDLVKLDITLTPTGAYMSGLDRSN